MWLEFRRILEVDASLASTVKMQKCSACCAAKVLSASYGKFEQIAACTLQNCAANTKINPYPGLDPGPDPTEVLKPR